MTAKIEKVTLSLPHNLITFADEIARNEGISRSKVVSACLQEFAERRLSAEMAEGYRAMAEENLTSAEQAIYTAHEILADW